MTNVKVSVLVPVYKTNEVHLRACIESILNQTFDNFELLLLDDCPEDTISEKIIKSYTDKRIKYFRNDVNLGISLSRNKLIDLAKGEYLAVMDHDDVSVPERLAKQVAFLDTHPEVGIVSGEVLKFPQNKISKNPIDDHQIKLALMTVSCIAHPAAMIRKKVLFDNNIRYEKEFSPAEDYALWCRLIPYTQFHNLPDVMLHYRWHANNTSITQNDKMRHASLAVRSFVQAQNPALYQEFLLKATQKSVLSLFGVLPLVTIVKKGYKSKIILFGCIPLFVYKTSTKLKGN